MLPHNPNAIPVPTNPGIPLEPTPAEENLALEYLKPEDRPNQPPLSIPNSQDPSKTIQKDAMTTAEWFTDRKEYIMAKNIINQAFSHQHLLPENRSRGLLLLARIARETGNPSEALVNLQTWIEQFPGRPELPIVNFRIARLYRQMRSYDRAREYFYRTMSSLIALASGKEEGVVQSEQRLSQAAKWELAETEYQAGNWKRAFELFERFRKQTPNATDLVEASAYRQGDCLYQQGLLLESAEAYQNALAIGPFHPFAPEAWVRLVQIYGVQKDFNAQGEALQSLIWLVSEAYPSEGPYWQRRVANVLIDFVKDKPEEAHKLLITLDRAQPSSGWKKIKEFLADLTARQDKTPTAANSSDGWDQWQTQVNNNNVEIRQKLINLQSF